MSPVLAFRLHLTESFPEFGDEITVKLGNDDSIIEFRLKNGFNDNFNIFFHLGIKTSAVVSHCRSAGVKRLVFIDISINQFDDISIDELENML